MSLCCRCAVKLWTGSQRICFILGILSCPVLFLQRCNDYIYWLVLYLCY
uniref:Uncharacterized protein n=1 Tax=Arundo donax TaxID=35708 RepID=A0A0A9HJX6_ARUDO